LDGYNGLSATVTGAPGVGPKLTVANAIAAAVNGDIISVANTGVAYGAVNTSGKTLTFTSTGGTPVVGNITIDAATIFTGPYNLSGTSTLLLTTGAVTGASNITVATGGTIQRNAGSLDSAPVFAGLVNLQYDATKTIGPEFPSATGVLNNLTVNGAITVTVNAVRDMKGTLVVNNAGGILALGANTLTLTNTTAAPNHNIVGAVTATSTGGLSVSTTTGNVTFIGGGTIPSITTSATTGLINVNGPVAISGSVTVNAGNTTLSTPTGVNGLTGSLINNGAGTVTVALTMTIGGNVSNTSSGIINFPAATIIVTGNVSNSGSFSNTSATTQLGPIGNINFGAGITTISGTLTNSASFSGSSSGTGGAAGGFTNSGNITFAATTQLVTVTGLITNSTSSTFSASAAANAGMFSGNGRITFANTTGNAVLTGGVTNSSTGFSDYGTTPTAPTVGNGSIVFTGRTTGTIASGTVTNSSSNTGATQGSLTAMASGSGDIEFGFVDDTDGAVTITGDVNLMAGSGSGDINFGGGALTVSGSVSNARTNTAAMIRQRGLLTATSNVSVGALSQTGTGQIQFAGTTATLTCTGVTINAGTILSNSTTGTISINGSYTQTAGAFTVANSTTSTLSITGTANISGGTFNHGNTGNTTGNLTISGDFTFSAGTLLLGTGARNFTLTGASISMSTGVVFTNGAAATLVFNRAISAQSLTSGVGVVWPGLLNINNTFPVAPTFNLLGANFGVAGNAIFTAGGGANGVNLNNYTLFVGGDFTNNSGYQGGANGFVSLNGGGAQTISGSANFYNIEVDKAAGVATFSDGTAGVVTYTITGTFNLTNSAVAVGAGPDVIAFNNATTAPTIVRNAGSFGVAPTFTSDVNVVYIGASKTFSNEVPTAASNKLVNLTVATTGAATVTANIDFAFKGILTVNSGQTLALVAQLCTANGPTINAVGAITSTTGYINLNRAAGTVVTTAIALPEVRVAAGSTGNSLSGTGISASTNNNLTLANGTAGITLTFTGNGPHVAGITTANANNTITLGSNVVASGALVHANGTIALGTNNLSVAGTPSSIGTTAAITGTGKLIFNRVGAQTFDMPSGAATIAANVEMNMDLAATTLTLTTSPLTITGNLTLTKGALTPTSGLNVNGSALNLTADASVAGAGVLTFAPPSGTTLTVTLAGATTFDNLTVNGDVTLAGTAGALTITNVLTHTSGLINFANRDIIVGTLTRAAGTYSATTGYLQVNTALTQGTGFSIPNLRINGALTLGSGQATVVTSNLYLNGVTLTHTVGGTARLSLGVADGSVPTITVVGAGNLDVAPIFAQGTANYTFTGATTPIVVNATSRYWAATPTTLANTVTINMTNNADIVRFDASRTVNGISSLNLTKGDLQLNNNVVLTLASGMVINKNANATLTLDSDANSANGTGSLSAPVVNLAYTGTQTTGAEYNAPTVVNNVTANAVTGGTVLTVDDARTVAGDLTANDNVTMTANTTVSGAIAVATGKTLTVTAPAVLTATGASTIVGTLTGTGAVNFSNNVTLGGFGITGTIGFVGTNAQTVTVPAAGANISNLNVNLTGTNPVLTVTGGNITITNLLTFTNGVLDMGSNTLVLPRPTGAANSGLAFDRSAVTGTKVGHVVGKISRAANAGDGQAGTNGRFEFPVGTVTGQYRPVSITFTPDYVVVNPVSIVVSHLDTSPTGTLGLPLNGGNGVTTGAYPNFYWLVSTTPTSLSSTQKFDIDFTANNIGVPYTSDQSLRIIRRQDGSSESNGWSMQGTAANYANYQVVNGTDTTVVARTVSGQGGLILQGSRFAIGVPARNPSFGTSPTTFTVAEAAATNNTVQLTAIAQNAGETITGYTKVSGPAWVAVNATSGLVTLTPDYTAFVTGANVFPVVVRATTSSALTTDFTLNVTVTNTDRAATFTTENATATIKNGVQLSLTYVAADADGDAIAYSVVADKVVATAPVISAAGVLTWTPAYADVALSPVTFTVTATSGTPALTATSNTVVTVIAAAPKGDADLNGSVTSADASKILQHVVGLITLNAEALAASDVNADGSVGALDAAWILYYVANGTWPTAKMTAAAGSVDFGKFASNEGSYALPINLRNSRGVLSVYSEVVLGTEVDYKGVKANVPEGWQVVSNFENGVLRVAMAGLTPLTDGSIAVIKLGLKNPESVVSVNGSTKMNDEVSATMSAKVREIPADFSLSQNYPNPFNPTTNIKYGLSTDSRVSLVVYNILGQAVRTLVSADQEAGIYNVKWDGTNDFGSRVSSGIYIYRITAGNFVSTIKMNLLK
jgi:hypothetical protein